MGVACGGNIFTSYREGYSTRFALHAILCSGRCFFLQHARKVVTPSSFHSKDTERRAYDDASEVARPDYTLFLFCLLPSNMYQISAWRLSLVEVCIHLPQSDGA